MKSLRKTWAERLVVGTLCFYASGCVKGPAFFSPKSAEGSSKKIVALSNTDGSISATIGGGSSVTQELAVTDGSLSGTSLSFPPGSLSVSITIQISEGQAIASTGAVDALALKNATSLQSRSTSVAVIADTTINATRPFSLSIPVDTGASLRLGEDAYARYVVLYKVEDAVYGTRLGFIPRSQFTITDGVAKISTSRFGVYEVGETDVLETAALEIVSPGKILTAKQVAVLAPVTFSKLIFDLASTSMSVTISGAAPASCRFSGSVDEGDDKDECDGVAAAIDGTRVYFVETAENKGTDKAGDGCGGKDDSAGVYLQISCILTDGRFVHSDWSEKIDIDKSDGDTPRIAFTSLSPTTTTVVPYTSRSSFTVAGTCSPSGTVKISVSTKEYSTSCNGTSFSKAIDVSGLSDAVYAVNASLLNEQNVAHATAEEASFVIDTSEPTVVIASTANEFGAYKSANATNWTDFPMNGTCSVKNQAVTIVYSSSTSFATTCSATGTWSKTLNVSSLTPDIYTTYAFQISAAGRMGFSSSLSIAVGAPLFGIGSDGTATIAIAASTSDLSDSVDANGKSLFRSARVDGSTTCSSGSCTFALGSSAASNFFVGPNDLNIGSGSEILWIVLGSTPTGAASCSASIGTYGYGRITSTDASGVTIARTTNNSPPTVTSTQSSGDNCVIQIVRVPNFQALTLTATGAGPVLSAPAYNGDGNEFSGLGGVLAMRVKSTLTYSVEQSLEISMSGKGYRASIAVTTQGSSQFGQGATSVLRNGAGGGGGSSGIGGAGGAGRGIGAAGQNGATDSQGQRIGTDALDGTTSDFLPLRLYLGGAGGLGNTAGSATNGYGGGIIMLFAHTMLRSSGSSSMQIYSQGNSHATYGGGGGGGGTLLLVADSLQGGLWTNVSGGNTVSTSPAGGAGGGGFSHLICFASASGVTTNFLGGIGSGGTDSAMNGSAGAGINNGCQ